MIFVKKGEYQITNALENMKNKGAKFYPGSVTEWLDCGNKNATVYTNQRYLEFIKTEKLVADSAKMYEQCNYSSGFYWRKLQNK
jgi:glucose-1-phosphate thymidylyltransferase